MSKEKAKEMFELYKVLSKERQFASKESIKRCFDILALKINDTFPTDRVLNLLWDKALAELEVEQPDCQKEEKIKQFIGSFGRILSLVDLSDNNEMKVLSDWGKKSCDIIQQLQQQVAGLKMDLVHEKGKLKDQIEQLKAELNEFPWILAEETPDKVGAYLVIELRPELECKRLFSRAFWNGHYWAKAFGAKEIQITHWMRIILPKKG